MIVWAVRRREAGTKGLVICQAKDREAAKTIAARSLLGSPDKFIVEPLSADGEAVIFNIFAEGEIDGPARRIGW